MAIPLVGDNFKLPGTEKKTVAVEVDYKAETVILAEVNSMNEVPSSAQKHVVSFSILGDALPKKRIPGHM